VSAVFVSCLALAATGIAGAAKPTRNDSFSAQIASATGRLADHHGRVRVGLFPVASNSDTRSVTIALTPRACRKTSGCARLRGTLHGSITRMPSLPDVGSQFTITGHGTVRPLGRVTASGTAHGVGFVAFGHETIRLTLTGGGGAVTVSGTSGRAPAFSSP
jgi:hypothetical protein